MEQRKTHMSLKRVLQTAAGVLLVLVPAAVITVWAI